MKAALALALVPLALAGASALMRPQPAPPLPEAAAGKADRLALADAAAFGQGWPLVRWIELPAPLLAEAVPTPSARPAVDKTVPFSGPVAPAAKQPKQPRPAGLCARHGLRQVWVSEYRWRCRKY
jgi:hypothetical protein